MQVVALGASTGGPKALYRILQALPPELPVPVVVAQHMAASFTDWFATWLQQGSRLPVHVVRDTAAVQPGAVYLAADGCDLQFRSQRRLQAEPVSPSRDLSPSVNLLFRSVARYFGGNSLGVLLTGMGADGADGLHTIKLAGGATLVQDQATSVVYGMPAAAMALGAAEHALPLEQIPPAMLQLIYDGIRGPAQ